MNNDFRWEFDPATYPHIMSCVNLRLRSKNVRNIFMRKNFLYICTYSLYTFLINRTGKRALRQFIRKWTWPSKHGCTYARVHSHFSLWNFSFAFTILKQTSISKKKLSWKILFVQTGTRTSSLWTSLRNPPLLGFSIYHYKNMHLELLNSGLSR